MSKSGVDLDRDFLNGAPKNQIDFNKIDDIKAFKDTLQRLTKSADDGIKEQAWRVYRNLFGYPFIGELLSTENISPDQINSIITQGCQSPIELLAVLQGFSIEGESQMDGWKRQFNGENPWKVLLYKHPERMLHILGYISEQINPNLESVQLILKQSPNSFLTGSVLNQIYHFESELYNDFICRDTDLNKLSQEEADVIVSAVKSPEVKEFYQLLRQVRTYIFDKQLAQLINAENMRNFVAEKDNIIKLANCYNNTNYAVNLLRKLAPSPFLKDYLATQAYGVDSNMRDDAYWLNAVYDSQLETKDDLVKVSNIISNLDHVYKIEPVMANVVLANLTEYFTIHDDLFLDEKHLEYFINKLLYSSEREIAEIQDRLVSLILVNIQNRQAFENLSNPNSQSKKAPYLSVVCQKLNLFDAIRKRLETLENKSYTPDEVVAQFQATYKEQRKKQYKFYLKAKRNWNSFLLENKDPKKFDDLMYFNMDNPSNISMIAQACQSLLDRYDNLENIIYLQNLRNKCIVYAALHGDKWAIGNVKFLTDVQKDNINLCLKARDKIDQKKARLYDAYHAKGYLALKYLGLGSKKSIKKDIEAFSEAKEVVSKKIFQQIDSDPVHIKKVISNTTKKPHKKYNYVRNRWRTVKTVLTVFSLGIPYLMSQLWKVYSNLRDKVAHFVLGQGTISMSGYKYWRKNYHIITDCFNGNTKPLVDMKTEINTQLATIKEVRDYLIKVKREIATEYLERREGDKNDELTMLLENIIQPAEKERKDIISKHASRVKELKKYLQVRNEELKKLPQTHKNRTSLEQLENIISKLDEFEKLNPHEETLLNRKLEHLEKHQQIKNRMPWLEAEDRLIETEDGKFCDVLHVKNAKNAGHDRPKKYALFFSGAEVTYVLDTRHFDYADNLEIDVLAVQNRGMTEGSKAKNMTASDLAKDGCAVIKDLIDKGVDPNDISVIGYCGGSPAAALTVELMNKKYNMPVKLVLDRTFSAISEIAKDKIEKFKETRPEMARFLPIKLAKAASAWVLKLLGWEVNVAKIIEKLPREQYMYYGIMPEKDLLNPTNNSRPHGIDRTVPHKASLHKGLAKKRERIVADLNSLQKELISLSKIIGININGDDMPVAKENIDLQSTLNQLFKVIEFHKKYLSSPKVDAGIGDDLHVANIKDFTLRDGTKLTDMVKAHIHQKQGSELEFVGGFIQLENSPKSRAIKHFIKVAQKSFNLNSGLSSILEQQYPDKAVSLVLFLNLFTSLLIDHTNKQAKSHEKKDHLDRGPFLTHYNDENKSKISNNDKQNSKRPIKHIRKRK